MCRTNITLYSQEEGTAFYMGKKTRIRLKETRGCVDHRLHLCKDAGVFRVDDLSDTTESIRSAM
jgi:hypothetical protein